MRSCATWFQPLETDRVGSWQSIHPAKFWSEWISTFKWNHRNGITALCIWKWLHSSRKNMAPFSCKCTWWCPMGWLGGGQPGGNALEAFLCEPWHKPWMLSGLKTKTAWVPEEPCWAPLTEAPPVKQKHQGPSNPHQPPLLFLRAERAFMAGIFSHHVSKHWQTFGPCWSMRRVTGSTGADSISTITALVTTCGKD